MEERISLPVGKGAAVNQKVSLFESSNGGPAELSSSTRKFVPTACRVAVFFLYGVPDPQSRERLRHNVDSAGACFAYAVAVAQTCLWTFHGTGMSL